MRDHVSTQSESTYGRGPLPNAVIQDLPENSPPEAWYALLGEPPARPPSWWTPLTIQDGAQPRPAN